MLHPRKKLVRDGLLQEAARLFHDRGFAHTNMNEIAKAMGLQRASMYHYFKNKEDILIGLVQEEAKWTLGLLRDLSSETSTTPLDRFRRVVAGLIVARLQQSGRRFLVVSFLESEMPLKLRKYLRETNRSVLDIYSKLIQDCVNSGTFRKVDIRVAAFTVIGMSNWTSWWFNPEGRSSSEEIASIVTDFAVHTFFNGKGKRKEPENLQSAIRSIREDLLRLERLAS